MFWFINRTESKQELVMGSATLIVIMIAAFVVGFVIGLVMILTIPKTTEIES